MIRTAGLFGVLALAAATASGGAHRHRATDPARVIGAPASSAPAPFEHVTREPRTVEATLVAAPARLSLIPGPPTDVYADNGAVPGPTLELREDDRGIVD